LSGVSVILLHMSKEKPLWLEQARGFCRDAGIKVYRWDSDTVTVEAESPDRAKQVASRLQSLGFQPIEDEDYASEAMLLLSRNPAATRAKQRERWASVDISRPPVEERASPLFLGALTIWLFWYAITEPGPEVWLASGVAFLIFLSQASRIWGWRLEMSAGELRVRRYFRWKAIPWAQIRAVEIGPTRRAVREPVILMLASSAKFRLGTFGNPFACALRNRLRFEIAQRHNRSQ
jgi:hypothetical protein